jgi:nitrate reductase assembly molybdenum cofactor insertion protein NarJ
MNLKDPALGPKQKKLIEDSAKWRLISMLFECPSDAWRIKLASLASSISDARLKVAAEAAEAEASEGLYYSIFGPGGPASPREVSYHRSVELGGLMSELAGYYEAFGYSPASRETSDHVAVEVDFVGFLRLKEAYAQACQDPDHAEITADAARHFIKDHLFPMAEPLVRLLENSGVHYLQLAARALVRQAGPK